MRYKASQGFKVHSDPERIYYNDPLNCDKTVQCGPRAAALLPPSMETLVYSDLCSRLRCISMIALIYRWRVEFRQDGGKHRRVRRVLEVLERDEEAVRVTGNGSACRRRCVIFSHDELHEGGGVEEGVKYICQCDVLYERVGNVPTSSKTLGCDEDDKR
mmetsp:Transcript_46910/g.69753  ORF Transcript_46910/g.69753 Transcript_46910/m.69753 type:complete len:159 (-) Transcript_46910:65-541(-)